MDLTEADKKRIEEEEEYRKKLREEAEYRQELTGKKKQGKKWYKKPLWIVILLFVFPPVGVFLMWKFTKWNNFLKIGITILLILYYVFNWTSPLISKFITNSGKVPPTPESISDSSSTVIEKPTVTPTPTTMPQFLNVVELKNKKYSDLEGILGSSHQVQEPKGTVVGIKDWNKGNFTIEVTYYSLNDPIQIISIHQKSGSSRNVLELFRLVGLDSVKSEPDETKGIQKKWNNVEGIYKVIYTTGLDGSSVLTIIFSCQPDRLNVCEYM